MTKVGLTHHTSFYRTIQPTLSDAIMICKLHLSLSISLFFRKKDTKKHEMYRYIITIAIYFVKYCFYFDPIRPRKNPSIR